MNISIEQQQFLINSLKELGMVIIDKKALDELLIETSLKTKVDARVKYISRKDAIAKYNLTRYWFDKYEMDPNSKLIINHGEARNSKKKYNEQSILDELKRQAF